MKNYSIIVMLLTALCFFPTVNSQTQICDPAGNIVLFSNYDGGILNIDVDVDIPDLKIGVVSYEATIINLSGTYVNNITEVIYAGYNGNADHCAGNLTVSINGAPASAITAINFAPTPTIQNSNGNNSSIVCAYSCDTSSSQGGCNTADQIAGYFLTEYAGSKVYSHTTQYGCWPVNSKISFGGNCCIIPHSGCSNTYNIITATACDTYTVPSGDETYTSSGTYLDTIPNVAGCDSILTIMLTINNSNTAFESATACDSYFWAVDGNTYVNSGIYSTTFTNVAGCDSTIILNLTIRTVDTSVTVNSTTLTANATGAYYQWIDCGTMLPISGEVNQSYTATANGSYAVIISEYGCTDTSCCYVITIVGIIENTFENSFAFFPNPTTGQLTITFKETYDQITLTVKSIGGKFISSTVIKDHEKVTLDIEGANGYYLVNIESSEGQHAILKILKQ